MREPTITIIVPVFNAQDTIEKCLDSLLGIDYPNYEIIIVDDGSTDRTKEILTGYKDRLRVIECQHSGPSKCRNIAAKQAKGDFLAFTDSDCIVSKDWLKELIKGLTDDKVVSVGGIQLSPEDETNFGKNVQAFFELTGFLGGYIKSSASDKLREVTHNPSCNVIYRKNILLDIGSFDESLWPSEDVDLDYRLKKKGYRFMFNPKAAVCHYRPQSLKQLSKMMFRYGYMQGILTKRYGFFRRIQIIPFISLLLIALILINPVSVFLLLIPYLFVLGKSRSFVKANFIVFFSFLSFIFWIIGLLKGLINLKNRY